MTMIMRLKLEVIETPHLPQKQNIRVKLLQLKTIAGFLKELELDYAL